MPIALRAPSREAESRYARHEEGACPTAADMHAWARSHPGGNVHQQFDCPSCDCGCPEVTPCSWKVPCCVRMVEAPKGTEGGGGGGGGGLGCEQAHGDTEQVGPTVITIRRHAVLRCHTPRG